MIFRRMSVVAAVMVATVFDCSAVFAAQCFVSNARGVAEFKLGPGNSAEYRDSDSKWHGSFTIAGDQLAIIPKRGEGKTEFYFHLRTSGSIAPGFDKNGQLIAGAANKNWMTTYPYDPEACTW